MRGDDNEQGPPIGQAITQACCNEHPPTGVLFSNSTHIHKHTLYTLHTNTSSKKTLLHLKHASMCIISMHANVRNTTEESHSQADLRDKAAFLHSAHHTQTHSQLRVVWQLCKLSGFVLLRDVTTEVQISRL